jgi:hypothetical protein
MEVLRCVLRKSQGIRFSSEELKQAYEILGDLIEHYQVAEAAFALNGKPILKLLQKVGRIIATDRANWAFAL